MNSNIRIGSLFGIPFLLSPSWFFILALVTWTYGGGLAAQFPALSAATSLVLGLVTALLLFASVLAHELGHSVVALRQGIGVKSITLFLFGGLASLEKESKTPADAFWVAIAGPLVSLALFGLLTSLGIVTGISGPFAAIISLLASVNLALGLFNLIPGLPLDGGNILKALVWKVTGNPYKGVKFASRVGQAFGWLAIASGLLPLIVFGSFGNIWNLLLGWFLLQNAGRAAQYASVQEQLTGLTAADAVNPDSPVIFADLSLREFADQRILSPQQWRKYLVINQTGQLLGEVAVDDLKTIPNPLWPSTQIADLVRPIEPSRLINSDQSLLEVIGHLDEQKLSALAVIRRDTGILVGLLEKSSVLQSMKPRAQATPA